MLLWRKPIHRGVSRDKGSYLLEGKVENPSKDRENLVDWGASKGETMEFFFFFFCRNYRTVEKEESAGHIRMYEVEMTLGKTVDIFLNGE